METVFIHDLGIEVNIHTDNVPISAGDEILYRNGDGTIIKLLVTGRRYQQEHPRVNLIYSSIVIAKIIK